MQWLLQQFQGIDRAGSHAAVQEHVAAQEDSPQMALLPFHSGWKDGALHRLPVGFKLPRCDCLTGFQLWWLGNRERRIPPFRSLRGVDFSSRADGRVFSQWISLMKHFEQIVKDHDAAEMRKAEEEGTDAPERLFKTLPADADILSMWSVIEPLVHEEIITPGGRQRKRIGQMKVTTMSQYLMNKRRRADED